jgi:hypothetical protein
VSPCHHRIVAGLGFFGVVEGHAGTPADLLEEPVFTL